VLQLAFNAKEAERQAQLAAAFAPGLLQPLDQAQAQARAGVALEHGGLFSPKVAGYTASLMRMASPAPVDQRADASRGP